MSRSSTPARRGRAHLQLAPVVEEWPDDLLTLLGQAREGYLANEPMPRPSAAVAAFMQVPGHGLGEFTPAPNGAGTSSQPDDEPEEIELSLLTGSPAPQVRRPLVAIGGAAAAILLVALGLRPMLGASAAEAEQTPATSVAFQPTPTPTTAPTADDDIPATTTATTTPPAAAPVPTPVGAGAATPDPTPPTPKPVASASPTTAVKTTTKSSTKKPTTTVPPAASPTPTPAAPAPTPAPPPTLAPAVGTSSRDAVLRYYDVANTRGKCVAKQPKGATRTQLIAACGAEPVPPANLVQYWAAKDEWSRCADPLAAKGWKQSKIEAACGAFPSRATYDVPANPYA